MTTTTSHKARHGGGEFAFAASGGAGGVMAASSVTAGLGASAMDGMMISAHQSGVEELGGGDLRPIPRIGRRAYMGESLSSPPSSSSAVSSHYPLLTPSSIGRPYHHAAAVIGGTSSSLAANQPRQHTRPSTDGFTYNVYGSLPSVTTTPVEHALMRDTNTNHHHRRHCLEQQRMAAASSSSSSPETTYNETMRYASLHGRGSNGGHQQQQQEEMEDVMHMVAATTTSPASHHLRARNTVLLSPYDSYGATVGGTCAAADQRQQDAEAFVNSRNFHNYNRRRNSSSGGFDRVGDTSQYGMAGDPAHDTIGRRTAVAQQQAPGDNEEDRRRAGTNTTTTAAAAGELDGSPLRTTIGREGRRESDHSLALDMFQNRGTGGGLHHGGRQLPEPPTADEEGLNSSNNSLDQLAEVMAAASSGAGAELALQNGLFGGTTGMTTTTTPPTMSTLHQFETVAAAAAAAEAASPHMEQPQPTNNNNTTPPALRRSQRKRKPKNLDYDPDGENLQSETTTTTTSPTTGDRKNGPAMVNRKGSSPATQSSSSNDGKSSKDGNNDPSCCICLESVTRLELSKINGCAHTFCYSCIEKWAERENTCPLCKVRFHKIERVHKVRNGKRKAGDPLSSPPAKLKNSKKVKNRDQRADLSSNALQGLLANMENGNLPHSLAQFIFSNVGGGLVTIGTSGGGSRSSRGGGGPGGSSFSTSISGHSIPLGGFSRSGSQRGGGGGTATFRLGLQGPVASVSVRAFNPNNPHAAGMMPGGSRSSRNSRSGGATAASSDFPLFRAGSPPSYSEDDDGLNFGEDDEDDAAEIETNFGNFFQRFQNISNQRNAAISRFNAGRGGGRSSGGGGGGPTGSTTMLGSVSAMGGGGHQHQGHMNSGISYALNDHDRNAGRSAETALEIEDSDDDDDDIVEVVYP